MVHVGYTTVIDFINMILLGQNLLSTKPSKSTGADFCTCF